MPGRQEEGFVPSGPIDEHPGRLGVPAPRTRPMASSMTTVPLAGKG